MSIVNQCIHDTLWGAVGSAGICIRRSVYIQTGLLLKTTSRIVDLAEGSKVDRWRVERKLGQGGFGAVYQVADADGKHYALKTECATEEVQILKMEVYVLTALAKRNSAHFCKIFDKGRWGSFFYMVMTLVGMSIMDLRKASPTKRFTAGTALGVGIQSLEALQELHSIGYIHRDVKPGNFAIGRRQVKEQRIIYVLDFGMCRRYIDKNGVIRRPRSAVGFRGTARYAALSCHISRELCRKDDLESWLYMLIEITAGTLPWKNISDLLEVGKFKKRCRTDPERGKLLRYCPSEYKELMRLIDLQRYYDTPPYKQLSLLLRQSFTTMNVSEFPYDWEKEGSGFSA